MTTATPPTAEAPQAASVPLPVPAEHLPGAIEALLLASDRPLPTRRLAQALGLVAPDEAGDSDTSRDDPGPAKAIRAAIDTLNREYEATGRSFRIESVAGGFRIMTLARYAPVLGAMHALRAPAKLSRAALETLAIIAYRQPIGRAQLEAIRGVACGEVLKTLLERRLITVVGRAEELGRPMLYGTTKQFLDAFGLASLKDLPAEGELKPAG